ncbi:hypothetical protein ZWY2020_029435 [Hordeum vulgare]|nr:hypothetical protein ZWY2020_029435 [Hordeum vulgare]
MGNTTTTLAATTRDSDEDVVAAEDEAVPASCVPSSAEPSLAKKLTDRMKTLFYMQTKGQYTTHVAQKESRQRDKLVMRKLDVHISSESEQDITPEAAWMQKNNLQWAESDKESDEEIEHATDEEYVAGSDG